MGVITVEQSVTGAAPSFTYSGTWTRDAADAAASGGTHSTTTTAGASVTSNVPTGKYGILILGDLPAFSCVISVSVDGGAAVNYTLGLNPTTAATQYKVYQTPLCPPIYFADTTITHTVTLTYLSGTGSLNIDAVEMYDTSNAMVMGLLLGFGHSIMYGYNPLTFGQYASPFIVEAARRLGLTVSNQGLNAEDLTNGQNSASNPQFFSNGAIANPGWLRSMGAGVWHLAHPQYAVILHGRNDTGYSVLYDAPPDGNASNGASALKQVQTVTAGATPPTGGTFNLIWNGITMAISPLNTQATINANLVTFAIPFTVALSQSSFSVANCVGTFTANAYGTQPSVFTINTAALTPNTNITLQAVNPAGRASSPAGAGFALARFTQRYMGRLWRMNLYSPQTKIFCMGQDNLDPNTFYAAQYNAAIQTACADPTVRNATYIATDDASKSIGNSYINADNVHPTQDGHYALADVLVHAITQAAAPRRGRGRQ